MAIVTSEQLGRNEAVGSKDADTLVLSWQGEMQGQATPFTMTLTVEG